MTKWWISRFFQSRGIDSLIILHQVQINHVTTFNPKEYPAKIFTSLFEWVRQQGKSNSTSTSQNTQNVSKSNTQDQPNGQATDPQWIDEYIGGNNSNADLPSFYCMVCGVPDHSKHDELRHVQFWERLDPNFIKIIRDKTNKNFYELITSIITYLLKYPQQRATFQQNMLMNLHCPFCQKKNANHDIKRHNLWRQLWKIDISPPKDPDPTDDLSKYTKGAFEYLMDSVPFHIPNFLLGLNNVRSFLEVLVTMWKLIRVHS